MNQRIKSSFTYHRHQPNASEFNTAFRVVLSCWEALGALDDAREGFCKGSPLYERLNHTAGVIVLAGPVRFGIKGAH